MKKPIFIRIYKNGELEGVKQFDVDQIVIGGNDDVQIQLKDEGVSPLHAVIEERDNGYYISDLGSQTGTLINGEKTFDDALDNGDEIQVGEYKLQFFIGIPKPGQPPKNVEKKAEKKQVKPKKADKPKAEAAPKPPAKEKKVAEEKVPAAAPKKFNNKPKAAAAAAAGTFAPPSERKSLEKLLEPQSGPVIEVVVAWQERIVATHHYSEKGNVTIGSSQKCDIVLPLPGVSLASFELLKIEELATVRIYQGMTGEFYKGDQKSSLEELIRQNRMVRSNTGYEMQLGQGEMVCLSLQGGLINIYVRYVPETPKPLAGPLFDLSASEVTGIVFSIVVAAVFGLYMMIYSPQQLDEENKLEEPIRKAVVKFNRIVPKKKDIIKPTVKPRRKKKIVKVTSKKRKSVQTTKGKPGKAAELKPTKSKKKAKTLTSARSGGAVKTGKKGSGAKSKKPDPSKVGLLGILSGKGTQKNLDKTFSGAGELIGVADESTGFAGQQSDRAGDNLGTKLKSTGAGGRGSSTIGISGPGTKGKGSGTYGYGTGGIGRRGKVDVNVGGQEAEFTGSIDKEAIRRVIVNNKRAIKACYDKALIKNKNLYGKLVIQWDIEEKGRVTNAKIKSNQLGSKDVANCIIRRLKTWTFPEPPPDQVARVAYPFVFTSQ